MQKNFTVVEGTDFRLEIPLLRDGVAEPYGEQATITLIVEDVVTLTGGATDGSAPICVPDPLDNKAIALIRAAQTTGKAGSHGYQCIVRLAPDDEQCVCEGILNIKPRLPAIA